MRFHMTAGEDDSVGALSDLFLQVQLVRRCPGQDLLGFPGNVLDPDILPRTEETEQLALELPEGYRIIWKAEGL